MTILSDNPFRRRRSATEDLFHAKREAVLAQAARMFADEGFDTVRLTDVADALGTSKASIYYYFRSKEEILREIQARGQARYFEALLAAETLTGTGKDKLDHLFREYIDLACSDIGRCIDIRLPRMRTRLREAEGRIVHLFDLGMSEGSLKPQNPKTAAHAAFALLNWLASEVRARGGATKAVASDQVLSMIWHGLAA